MIYLVTTVKPNGLYLVTVVKKSTRTTSAMSFCKLENNESSCCFSTSFVCEFVSSYCFVLKNAVFLDSFRLDRDDRLEYNSKTTGTHKYTKKSGLNFYEIQRRPVIKIH